jgi:hypothetical protein
MTAISLFSKNVFVFIAVVIISAVVVSIYMSIKPEKTTPFNFAPFPKIAPTALPDPDRLTDNCFTKLTPCDENGECSACSLDNYECKTVTKEQAKAKLYHINGMNVPEGKWCLPKDHNPRPCNSFTGRYLWVDDPAYCNSVTPGRSQCWKCECLYPSLFGDPTTGCTTKLACQNDSVFSNSVEQPENGLVGTNCAGAIARNKTWDPTKEQKEAGPLYQYTPYDQDKGGKPWFACKCNQQVNGQFFAQLPGDPYNCHLEPCYKSLGYKASGLQNCDGTRLCQKRDSCSCSCDSPNVAVSPSGKFANTCVLISQSCSSYGYDKMIKKCVCPSPTWERTCRNPNTGVNMDNEELPICKQPENALGSECVDPCEGATCQHGAFCISCGTDSWEATPFCAMPVCEEKNGKIECSTEPEKLARVHPVCDCTTTTNKPDPPFSGYNGNDCSILCLPGGTKISAHIWGGTCECYKCSCCCSQNKHKEKDTVGISYEEFCDGGYPYPPQPGPDPECSPPESCKTQRGHCNFASCTFE